MSSPPKKLPIHLQSSQSRLLIKNGRIVNDDAIFDADIFIENGVIAQIGTNLIVPGGVRVIDVRASEPSEINYVLPGGIDGHTHIQAQFEGVQTQDDYYTGTRAAIAGGTTTVINFALTSKQAPSLLEAFDRERKLADGQVCCDYALHVGISDWNEQQTEQEIAKLVNEHGVNTFKVFLCYSLQLNDRQLIRILHTCAKYGAMVVAHCENGDIIEFNANKLHKQGITGPEGHLLSRPESIEASSIHRANMLAEQVGCPLMVAHVMSRAAAKAVADARASNSNLFAETLGVAVATDGANYHNRNWRHAAGFVMSPPLRDDKQTPNTLLSALGSGSLQMISSDHCVFSSQQKAIGQEDFRKIPNGVNGVEERMMVTWEKGVRGGFLDPCKFVAITSTNAAKLYNLYPRKGRIQVGSDADLVIWGKSVKVIGSKTHQSKCDFNVFEGLKVQNGPLVVVSNGRVVLDQTGLHPVQGSGRYLARQPFALTAYGRLIIKNRLAPIPVDRSAQPEKEETQKAGDSSVAHIEAKLEELSVTAAGSKSSTMADSGDAASTVDGFHSRASKNGVKNMQDSTFKFSGEQLDDKQNRSNIRVSGQPPGGRSSGLW